MTKKQEELYLASLTKSGIRVKSSSFDIRRRLRDLVDKEEYQKILQLGDVAIRNNHILSATLPDVDDGNKYDWVMVGEDKYSRLMYCLKTKGFRHLTMGEFYENATID